MVHAHHGMHGMLARGTAAVGWPAHPMDDGLACSPSHAPYDPAAQDVHEAQQEQAGGNKFEFEI